MAAFAAVQSFGATKAIFIMSTETAFFLPLTGCNCHSKCLITF